MSLYWCTVIGTLGFIVVCGLFAVLCFFVVLKLILCVIDGLFVLFDLCECFFAVVLVCLSCLRGLCLQVTNLG